VLFFVIFFVFFFVNPLWKRLNSAIFRSVLLFFGFFFRSCLILISIIGFILLNYNYLAVSGEINVSTNGQRIILLY